MIVALKEKETSLEVILVNEGEASTLRSMLRPEVEMRSFTEWVAATTKKPRAPRGPDKAPRKRKAQPLASETDVPKGEKK